MYWYEKDRSLFQFEKDCYMQFLREYNHPDCRIEFTYDKENHFIVLVDIPFQMDKKEPWRMFKYMILYEHDHPGRDSTGNFGGSIKVYPFTQLKPGFHHLLTDSVRGLRYLCQVKSAKSSEVNGYKVLQRILRFQVVYCTWEKTGVDVDK